eukprot:COSAG05_NODE_1123_length_5793_cov_4.158588_8_plen_124_part_00
MRGNRYQRHFASVLAGLTEDEGYRKWRGDSPGRCGYGISSPYVSHARNCMDCDIEISVVLTAVVRMRRALFEVLLRGGGAAVGEHMVHVLGVFADTLQVRIIDPPPTDRPPPPAVPPPPNEPQ